MSRRFLKPSFNYYVKSQGEAKRLNLQICSQKILVDF